MERDGVEAGCSAFTRRGEHDGGGDEGRDWKDMGSETRLVCASTAGMTPLTHSHSQSPSSTNPHSYPPTMTDSSPASSRTDTYTKVLLEYISTKKTYTAKNLRVFVTSSEPTYDLQKVSKYSSPTLRRDAYIVAVPS